MNIIIQGLKSLLLITQGYFSNDAANQDYVWEAGVPQSKWDFTTSTRWSTEPPTSRFLLGVPQE